MKSKRSRPPMTNTIIRLSYASDSQLSLIETMLSCAEQALQSGCTQDQVLNILQHTFKPLSDDQHLGQHYEI